jgi:hypothetical protein
MNNVQKISGSDSFHVIEKGANQYLMMQPFADFQKSKAYLEKQGLEVVGILGTSHIGKIPKSLTQSFENSPHILDNHRPMGYKYLNVARLNPNSTQPPIEYDFFLSSNIEEPFLKSGLYTTIDGTTKLLDFENLTTPQIKQAIEKLKQDKNVLAITLNGKGTQIGSEYVEANRVAQARAFMAFDTEGKFLGSFVSPPIGVGDSLTIAKAHYGDKAGKVVNLDGDFYAKPMLYYDDIPSNDPLAERFIASMLLVQPKNTLPTNTQKLEVKPASDCAYAVASGVNLVQDITSPEKVSGKLQGFWEALRKKVGF